MILRKIDRNMESYLETEIIAKKCAEQNTYTATNI